MHRSRWLWRWRRNPLRRRSYLIEAWALPAAGLAAACGAVLTAVVVAGAVHGHLAQQRQDRHQVSAVLTESTPPAVGYGVRPSAVVRWTSRDGTRHTATARVDPGLTAGSRVTVWTDVRGRVVSAPLSPARARLDAVTSGAIAGLGTSACAAGALGLAVRAAGRRRAESWAAEWADVGPRWDRRSA
jgi:hypothetical protein